MEENEYRFKCDKCGEWFNHSDEVVGLNCNNEIVSLSEYDIERNVQNLDSWVITMCNECYEEW